MNRSSAKNMIMYSTEGGMDIETVAEKTPELIHTLDICPEDGITNENVVPLAPTNV